MSKYLGQYATNYKDVCLVDNIHEGGEDKNENEIETNDNKFYTAFNKITKKDVTLKIISKQKLKDEDYDFCFEQLNREEQLTKLCSSPYTVKFYQRFETDDYIIFELEQCDTDAKTYIFNN